LIVRFSRTADCEIDVIRAYIAETNERAADRVVARILQSIQYLETFPELGRRGRLPGTREPSIAGQPYLVIYRIEGDLVRILTVIHTSRRWPG